MKYEITIRKMKEPVSQEEIKYPDWEKVYEQTRETASELDLQAIFESFNKNQ